MVVLKYYRINFQTIHRGIRACHIPINKCIKCLHPPIKSQTKKRIACGQGNTFYYYRMPNSRVNRKCSNAQSMIKIKTHKCDICRTTEKRSLAVYCLNKSFFHDSHAQSSLSSTILVPFVLLYTSHM